MQGQLHTQMDVFRRQVSSFRGGEANPTHPSNGPAHDEFRSAAGRVRRTRFGRPDGGEAPRPPGSAPAGMAGGAVRQRAGGVPDGGMVAHGKGRMPDLPAAPGVMQSARVHRPQSGKWNPPPKKLAGRSAQEYLEMGTIAEAAEWLADQRGRPGMMPSDADLRAVGMSGVADAIPLYHGGYESVAAKLGLQVHHNSVRTISLRSQGVEAGAWNRFANMQQAVLELAELLCAPDTMPSYAAMRAAGLGAVADAVRIKHGGMQAVAERLGLQIPSAFAE